MARRAFPEMTIEEFDAWAAAHKRTDSVAERADEGGGPRLSLVPVPEQQDAWPTDWLAPVPDPATDDAAASDATAPAGLPVPATPFDGVPLEDSRNRLAGWSAERQRVFLTHLAETGSVHLACSAARLSARGAYR